jgi:hypothetical protein
MLEFNTELNALSISGFHYFNERAFKSLNQSLGLNQGLQTLDMGNLTQRQVEIISKTCEKKDVFFHQPERILREKKVDPEATGEFS